MLGNGDSIANFVLLGELDLLEEDRRRFNEYSGFPHRHSGLRVEPQIALKQADALLFRSDREHFDALGVGSVLLDRTFVVELVIRGGDGDILAAGLLHFGLDEARDHFLLNGVIALKTKDLIADLAELGNGAQGDQFALFLEPGQLGIDGDVHLRAAQGGLLGLGGVLVLGDDRQIRIIGGDHCVCNGQSHQEWTLKD